MVEFRQFGKIVSGNLFQEGQFNEQADYDEFCWEDGILPRICLDLADDNPNSRVERIRIGFAKDDDPEWQTVHFDQYELLLPSFMETMSKGRELEFGISPYRDSRWHKFMLSSEFNPAYYKTVQGRWSDLSVFEDIWNMYCLYAGNTSLPRDQFLLWVLRLHCLAYDIIDAPRAADLTWEDTLSQYRYIVSEELSARFEFSDQQAWRDALESDRIGTDKAMSLRLQDAVRLLNEFFQEMEPTSPLENFLIECYESFGRKLQRENLVLRCQFCRLFMPYRERKKYCSLRTEGRDCGKRARNQKYYERKGADRRAQNRQSTRDLRAFYKEKGVKK
ncbi:MAG: hypothetical protein NT028_08545 [candidate division Zixibacteria bacterium]|nr:hypothetical protein [candidate division Zixibacteria bacterium]